MKPKGNNEQAQKCDIGYNAHKPREKCPAKNESCNKCRKIRRFPKCAEVGKALLTCWIKWTIQEMNIPVMSKVLIGTYILQLLHVASLEINGINDNQNVSEKDEWCEFLEVGNSTLFCQLDSGVYARVINTTQLRQIAPNALLRKPRRHWFPIANTRSNQRVMSPFQYDLKNKELNVNFYLDVIDNKQTPILSGKHCQALDLGQQVHKIDVNFKELLDQHPGVQNTSRAMPGTSSIEIDPTVTPVVHGPRRRPAACSSYEKFSICVLTLSLLRSHQ